MKFVLEIQTVFVFFYCLVNYNKKLMYSSLILCKIITNLSNVYFKLISSSFKFY